MESSLLNKTFITCAGVAGLAVGFVGGYLVPRENMVTLEKPAIPRNASSSHSTTTTTAPEGSTATRPLQLSASASSGPQAANQILSSLPAPAKGPPTGQSERYQWVEKLPASDIPLFIEAFCAANSGPEGMKSEDRLLVKQALRKWGRVNRQAVLDWVSGLPPGPTKRFLFSRVLETLLIGSDPELAMELAEDFQVRDPGWDFDEFSKTIMRDTIDKAWKNPATTAQEMLDFYKRIPSGRSTTYGTPVGDYPENFDFRTFLDGMADLVEKKKKPARFPTDALKVWAKSDPQAAAAWLMEATDKRNADLPFYSWNDIAQAVSSVHGSQVYYDWAATVLGGASDKFLSRYLQNPSGGDVLGILAATRDSQTRNRLLTAALGGADIETSIRYLGMISTPELRLRAIAKNRYALQKANQKFHLDDALVRDLGLTREQVDEALKHDGTRDINGYGVLPAGM
jgi:hypothetical protein